MKRRNFLQTAATGVIVPTVLNGLPVNAYSNNSILDAMLNPGVDTDHVLVLIYLGGGNDGLNTVIPIDQYSKYVAARPNVFIEQSKLLALNGQSNLALHPSLKGFQTLYNENKLTIVQSVGYPNPDYSHFRSTDIWATASNSDELIETGWLGRYLNSEYPGFPLGYPNANNPDPLAVQVGGNLPLLFQGPNAQMAMNVSNPDIFGAWPGGIDDPAPNNNLGKELSFIRTIGRQSKSFADAIVSAYLKGTNVATYPAGNYLAETLKVIARVIKGGLKTRLYLVNLYGFDTHADQVMDANNKTKGVHATLLQYLADGALAFQRDLEAMSIDHRVLGMTFSEFGRRIKDNMSSANGAGGTDHGAAAPLFLFGKNVIGGVVGNNPFIPTSVNVNDNLPMQYDFRSIYTSVLQDWFCVKDPSLTDIMLRNFQSLPVVQKSNCITGVDDLNTLNESISLDVSSNPLVDRITISIKSFDGYAVLQLINPLGTVIKTVHKGKLKTGSYQFDLENENYPVGNYYLRLQQGAAQKTIPLMIVR